MAEPSSPAPLIRAVAAADMDRIVEIDVKVLGKPRPDYWQTKLDLLKKSPHISFLVAEIEGRVVGFIIGGVSRWEYGMPENIGWIDTIGVDPEHQRSGVAKLLFARMAAGLKLAGVDTIHTFVKRRDWRLLKFFGGLGFQPGDMTSLELEI